MPKFYKFILYSFYKFFIGIGKKDIPEGKAILIFSLWIAFYSLLLYPVVRYYMPDFYIPKWIVGSFYVVITLLHFIVLLRDNNYLKIYREFEKDREYREKHKLLVPVFLLFPFLVIILYVFTIWR